MSTALRQVTQVTILDVAMIDPTKDIRDSMIPIIDVSFLRILPCKSKELQYPFPDSNIHSSIDQLTPCRGPSLSSQSGPLP
jgi:hypothetical protein